MKISDLCSIVRKRGVAGPDDVYVGLEHIAARSGLLTPTTVAGAGIKSSTFAFVSGCVLYGKLRPYLNKVALPDFDGFCSTDILPLAPVGGVDRSFLAAVLRSSVFLARVSQLTTGANLPRISPDALLAIEVEIPTDSKVQEKVVAAVEELEAANRALATLSSAVGDLSALPEVLLAGDGRGHDI